MSDSIDHAVEIEDFMLQTQLTKRRDEAADFTGFCLYCEEPVEQPHRWCDVACRDDYQKQQARVS